MTRLRSHRGPPPPLAHSLAENEIGDKGASALAAVLKETKITNLKCAAATECLISCQRPLTLLTLPAPPSGHSLDKNAICGLDKYDQGTYAAEGITKLCEGLKESSVTSLRCAHSVCLCVSAH